MAPQPLWIARHPTAPCGPSQSAAPAALLASQRAGGLTSVPLCLTRMTTPTTPCPSPAPSPQQPPPPPLPPPPLRLVLVLLTPVAVLPLMPTAVLVLGQLMVLVVHRANSQCGLACAALLALPAAQVGSSSTSKHVEPLREREHTHAVLRSSGCCSTLNGIWPFVVDCVGLAHGVRTQWLLVRVVLSPLCSFAHNTHHPQRLCHATTPSVWNATPH